MIDLKDQKIVFGNNEIKFELDEFKKKCLIEDFQWLKLKKSEAIKNIDILFRREMVTGAYKPKLLKTILEDGRKVMSLAFTVDKKHKNYFQNKAIQTKAIMISNAHGFLGTCEEYFSNTLQSLSELNIVDSEMIAISKHLKND